MVNCSFDGNENGIFVPGGKTTIQKKEEGRKQEERQPEEKREDKMNIQ